MFNLNLVYFIVCYYLTVYIYLILIGSLFLFNIPHFMLYLSAITILQSLHYRLR